MVMYRRLIRVHVARLTLTEPRMIVEVERHGDSTQTTGNLKIYNLAPENERQIYDRGTEIIIEAGYPETIGTILEGAVQSVHRGRRGLAHVTELTLGDAVRGPLRLGGVTSRTWAGAVSVRAIVLDFARDLQLDLGPLDAIPSGASVIDHVWSGGSAEGLTRLLRRVGCKWYEDDRLIRIRRVGMAQPDAAAFTLSPAFGLVGTPEETEESGGGIRAVSLLNPSARIGGHVDLVTSIIGARYRIVAFKHMGDNWEGRFITEMELRP